MIDGLAYAWCAVAVLVFMTAAFLASQVWHRLDVADVAWGGVSIAVALVSFFLQPDANGFTIGVRTIVTCLVVIWGMRLSGHIYRRLQRHATEDARYTAMRKSWRGNPVLNAYFRVFLAQGILGFIIATPVAVLNLTNASIEPSGLRLLAVIAGVLLWLAGFAIETLADAQLRAFLAKPAHKGKLLTSGIWRYSRHPNYFGEVVQWWGLFVVGLSLPLGLPAIIGPVLITYLIVFVSGVPLLEKKYDGRPGWKAYKATTSMLIPWPPKRST